MAAPSGGSSVPPLNVRIVISTSGAAAASSAMRGITTGAGGMNRALGNSTVSMRTLGDAMRQSASLIKYSVMGAFVNAGTQAITMARQFEISMSRIQGLVGESAAQIEKYKESVLKMGHETAKAPVELADALYFITSAGIKGSKALEVLRQSARSAAAGLGETKIVADALTSIMNAYGESTYSASYANDILVATVREGKAEAEEFAPALGKVLPVAAAFGASFEDVSAGVAALTRGGASAGTSAIYLRQVLSQLLKPSKQAADTMLSVGTSAADLRKRIQEDGLLTALEYLNSRLGGNQYNIASEGLTKVFGNVRALTAVFSLLGPNLEANRLIFHELNNATGDASKAFDVYSQTADAKFKRASADIQSALINLGEAIMPVATMIMQVGGAFARLAGWIISPMQQMGKFGKVIGTITRSAMLLTAAFLFLAKGGLFVFTRVASLIRLFANMQITMKALTMGFRTQTGVVKGLGMNYSLLGVSAAEQLVIENALQAATAKGAITQKAALKVVADNTTNKKLFSIATKAQTADTALLTVANKAEATSAVSAAIATKVFGAALMQTLPFVIGIGAAVMSIASLFGMDLFGGLKDSTDSAIKDIGDLKEILGGVTNLDEVDFRIVFNPLVQFDKTDINSYTAEEIKTLEEQLTSAKVTDQIEGALKTWSAGSPQATMFAAALVNRLGMTGRDRDKFKAYLADKMSIEFDALPDVKFTGDLKANGPAATRIAEQIATSILGEDKIQYALKDKLENIDIGDSAAVLNLFTENLGDVDYFQDIDNGLKSIGKTMGVSFDSSKNIFTFAKGLQNVTDAIESSSANAITKGTVLKNFYREAFRAVTELGDFKNEADGLSAILGSEDNANAVISTFTQITNSSSLAVEMQKKFADEYKKLGSDATQAQEMQVFADVISWATKQVANSNSQIIRMTDNMQILDTTVMDVAGSFENGLNPAIQDIVDGYEAAEKAQGFFDQGQKAIIDTARRLPDAQADIAKAVRDVNSALSESGGKVGVYGEEQNNAREAVNGFVDALAATANAQMLTPGMDITDATATITEGYSRIRTQLMTQGKYTAEQADTILADAGLTNFGQDFINSLFGANAVGADESLDKNILNKVSEGIALGADRAAEKAAPGITKFNEILEKQFTDYWAIKSPSKRARDEIGLPIAKGLIDGLVGSSAKRYASGKIPLIAAAIKKNLVSSVSNVDRFVEMKKTIPTRGGGVMGMRTSLLGAPKKDDDQSIVSSAFDTNKNTGGKGGKGGKGGSDKKEPIYLKGEKAAQQKIEAWLERIGRVSTAFTDKIEKVLSDASSALGYTSAFIDAQLGVSKSVNDRQKLLISQELLAANLAKAQREQMYSTMRAGANLGRDVTGYEVSRIQDLQNAYEAAVRNYSMKRGSYADMIDAQIALQEAQAAAADTSADAVSAETGLLDAKNNLKNKDLELAKATMDVVEAQQKQVDAAIQLRIHMNGAKQAFEQFANQALPGVVGSIDDLGLKLTDPSGVFMTSLHGLGESIFSILGKAAQEQGLIDSLPDNMSPPATPGTGTGAGPGVGAGTGPAVGAGNSKHANFGKMANGKLYGSFMEAVRAIHPAFSGLEANGGTTPVADSKLAFPALYALYKSKGLALAKGGLVMGATQALIGEAGPELVLPLNNMNITTALERLTNVKQQKLDRESDGNRNTQVFNIVVNNPVPETASESISRRMKTLSNAGLFG